MLNSEESCREYLETQAASTIALQLKRDHELCLSHRFPSLLALYLPSSESRFGSEIGQHLFPATAQYGISITRVQYSSFINVLKGYLGQINPSPSPSLDKLPTVNIPAYEKPSKDDFEAALKVIEYCLRGPEDHSLGQLHLDSPVESIISSIKNNLKDTEGVKDTEQIVPEVEPDIVRLRFQKYCYICKFQLINSHPQYTSLCRPCGDFNLASSALSLPENLKLHSRTAFITGGRINLGYHTALRLLRCGAQVIVTSRYPRDAAVRYEAEADSTLWSSSLKIIGADFRAAKDVFNLVIAIKQQLKVWDNDNVGKLDILINNAAQTLTDPVSKEKQAIKQEYALKLGSEAENLLLQSSQYEPRIRGGVHEGMFLPAASEHTGRLLHESEVIATTDGSSTETTKDAGSLTIVDDMNDIKSSWLQSIHEIPYEDVISAHSVNTFVPLILLRELLPSMGSPLGSSPPPKVPKAYILNISSREGLFEPSPSARIKNGKHVHTNLTKAALNMLTETEAAPAWRERGVAINSIDPGYMSAAPEIEKIWKERGTWNECPIGWEDGAGRVLWPVAVGEKGEAVWGRFLKNFGGTEVDVGKGM